MMASITHSALRQASRAYARRFSSTQPGLSLFPQRAIATATVGSSAASRRGYVTETKAGNAQVSVDTAIKQEQKAFMNRTGVQPGNVDLPGTGVSGDAALSPSAGILKQATIMDHGTRPIYLDMQSTTPMDPRVVDAMLPYMTGIYGNPHSRTHAYGWESEKAVEQARENVAK